jgi:hypothetical protein
MRTVTMLMFKNVGIKESTTFLAIGKNSRGTINKSSIVSAIAFPPHCGGLTFKLW